MAQFLPVSRAARLAGVSRGELQNKIRELALPTFEGKIGVDDLLRAYPEVDMERDPVLERVELIKSDARPKQHYGDLGLPEPEVLMARLRDFRKVLIRTKTALNTSQELLREVVEQLEPATHADEAQLRVTIEKLSRRLRGALSKAEENPDQEAELFAKDAILRIFSASAQILPSGHEYFVEGSDSLLEAALKSGLHLDYGCSSGNCGACKVRVLSGQVRKIRHHDFVLSAKERASGYILACANTAVDDVVLQASEALTASDLPYQQIRCTLRKVEPANEDLVLITIRTPRTQTLRFMAGQRVKLTTEDGLSRTLPVASCPCDACNLQFLIRRRQDDSFVATLLSGNDGQTVLLEGPIGDFLLEEEATDPAVFVAVGDGFAPIKSLVEHAIAIDNVARMQLIRVDEAHPGSLLDNLCRSWNDALDNFAYRRVEAGTSPAHLLKQIVVDFPKLAACHLYVVAPAVWMQDFAAEARARGTPDERLHLEAEE